MIAVCVTLVNSQYFSSHDGINLPRNGKRSSPLSNLVRYKNMPNKLSSFTLYKLHSPISFDRVYHQDKLSYRKYFKKFGKRFMGGDDDQNSVEFDFIKEDDYDKMMRKFIIDYLADKKVPIIVEMDNDSSSSSSEEKAENQYNTDERK